MPSWAEFAAAEPELAAKVRERFGIRKHKTMASLRKDGSPRQLFAEVIHQRFIRKAVKTIAANACIEVGPWQGKPRRDFRDRAMKRVVEASEMRGEGKD